MARAKSTKSSQAATQAAAHNATSRLRAAPSLPSKSDPKKFDYDAIAEKSRRRAPASASKLVAEHAILPASKRRRLLATVQDQIRNASIAAWMVRRHLDYVSRFRFQFRSGNENLDKLVSRLFDWHARPVNFDVAARMGREEMFRMFEAEKVTAGDAGLAKLMLNGAPKLQAIESDLIAYPTSGKKKPPATYEAIDAKLLAEVDRDTGAVMSPNYPGRVAMWCICNRGWNGKSLSYDHLEKASNVIFGAYYTRLSSQVRGVSPLTVAVNTIQDLYEGFEWNLLKAKIHAIFGVALMRDYAGPTSDQEEVNMLGAAGGITTGQTENEETAAESDGGTKSITSSLQQLTPDSMMMVDMESKGRIDTIESRTPSSEFQDFSELMMRVAMLALDIPFSAFDSGSSSFSGMIADQNFYEVSCRWKREKNKWARQEYSDWLLGYAWEDAEWGLREVANAAGITRLRELQEAVEWIPSGAPWLQKLQEVEGDIKAIAAGIDNPQDICKRRGTDVFDNLRKTAEVYEEAKRLNVPLMIGEPGQAKVEEAAPTAEQQEIAERDQGNE